MNAFDLAENINYALKVWDYNEHNKKTNQCMEIICQRDKYSLLEFYKKIKEVVGDLEGTRFVLWRYVEFLNSNN